MPIKTIKMSLTTAKASGISIDHLLKTIRSTKIGLNFPSPCKILHNHAEECPGQPSKPMYVEEVRNYLKAKKTQKRTIPTKDTMPAPVQP